MLDEIRVFFFYPVVGAVPDEVCWVRDKIKNTTKDDAIKEEEENRAGMQVVEEIEI